MRTVALVTAASVAWALAACSDSSTSPDSSPIDSGVSLGGSGGSPDASSTDSAIESGGDDGAINDAGPTCPAGSFYSFEAFSLDRDAPVSMCEFKDKVVLVSNIAAKCGYTPQLGVLASVQATYYDQDLVVLGFYCNQFGNQAGTEEERDVCQEKYRVNFEVFDVINVNPPDEHPLFTWFKSQEGFGGKVQWNFEKFLVSRDGELIGRWPSTVEPDDPKIIEAIDAALAAP